MSDSVRPPRRQPTRLPHLWDSPGKNTGVGCHFLLQYVKVKSLSRVQLFETPWTAAYQALPSMGFSRQEYWSGVPLPSPKAPKRPPKPSAPYFDPADEPPPYRPREEISRDETLYSSPSSSKTGSDDSETPKEISNPLHRPRPKANTCFLSER